MLTTRRAIEQNKQIRIIGFDDAPFDKEGNQSVSIAGVVCSNTRFEGMVWGELEKDGLDATQCLVSLLKQSKFYPQLHAVLLDGVAFGGFNIVDLEKLNKQTELPCISVMRKPPDMPAIDRALQNFADYELRRRLLLKAGQIQQVQGFIFQSHGLSAVDAGRLL